MATYEHLTIRAVNLTDGLSFNPPEGACKLDLETGEVVWVGGPDMEEGEADLDDPERNLTLEPIPSPEAFGIREAFVAGLPASPDQRAIERALARSRPFRGFKDTLCDFEDLRQAWFKFHDARRVEKAQAWIEDWVPGARLDPGGPQLTD